MEMKIQEINAREVWANKIRIGFIVENWFYPAPGVQISPEELRQIAKAIQAGGRLERRPITQVGCVLANDMSDRVSESLSPGEQL